MAKLPLPDEQPLAVYALRIMRPRIAGEIAMHSREIDRLRAELVHLDATLRLFDPATDPNGVPAPRRYPKLTAWFARGAITRCAYEALRDAGIGSLCDLAKRAMAEKGLHKPGSVPVGMLLNVAPVIPGRGRSPRTRKPGTRTSKDWRRWSSWFPGSDAPWAKMEPHCLGKRSDPRVATVRIILALPKRCCGLRGPPAPGATCRMRLAARRAA
jgi:hypothetical protein